jgi:hypothetical protein
MGKMGKRVCGVHKKPPGKEMPGAKFFVSWKTHRTSLRRHDPDQVPRVEAKKPPLSRFAGPPSCCRRYDTDKVRLCQWVCRVRGKRGAGLSGFPRSGTTDGRTGCRLPENVTLLRE